MNQNIEKIKKESKKNLYLTGTGLISTMLVYVTFIARKIEMSSFAAGVSGTDERVSYDYISGILVQFEWMLVAVNIGMLITLILAFKQYRKDRST